MLASGAHVKIGDKEFRLKFDEERPYSYSLRSTGEQVQFWLWDDWSGGEGNDAFDATDETVYHQGKVNPRLPGILTSPPTRTPLVSGALSPAPDTAFGLAAGGRLWFATETISGSATSLHYTTDFASFTEEAMTGWNAAVDTLVAACTDGTHIYLVGQDVVGGTYDYQIVEFEGISDNIDTERRNIRDYANGNSNRIIGIGKLGNRVYTWNGAKLREHKAGETLTSSSNDIVSWESGVSPTGLTYGSTYFGGVVQGDDVLYPWFSTEGRTVIYEKRRSTGSWGTMWEMPNGFTGKAVAYQQGAVVVVGEYLGNAAAYAMSVVSRQPIFLGYLRLGTSISPSVAGSSFGSEVIFSEKNANGGAKVFVYDLGTDAFSQLDEVTYTNLNYFSAGAFEDKRWVAGTDGSALVVHAWDTDDSPSTTVDGRWESGVWDMDLPEDEKQLDGFHILADLSGTKSATIYYQDDEDGTWTSAGQVTAGFHNYVEVSTGANGGVQFRSLRIRVDTENGAEVYAVSARYRVTTYEETWELLLDLTNEETDQSRARRRRSHSDKGWQLRSYIRDIADNKDTVTFLDGAPYPQGEGDDPDKYNTHTVVADILDDRLLKPGEGSMLIRLRSTGVN